MSLESLNQLPQPETEPSSDWAVMATNGSKAQQLWLAYACQRDFLSVPKTYAIVTFSCEGDYPIEFHQMDRIDYLMESQLEQSQAEPGLYELPSEEGKLLLFIGDETVFEVACDAYRLLDKQYHHSDANGALFAAINLAD